MPIKFLKNVLAMLKNDSKKVGLISNWDMTARNVLKVNELYDFFDEIVISSEVNIEKPRTENIGYSYEKNKCNT